MEFKCSHCKLLFNSFENCISHNISVHPEVQLTYLYLSVNPSSGKRYKQRNFSVVPQGKHINILPNHRISVEDPNAKDVHNSCMTYPVANSSKSDNESDPDEIDPDEIKLQADEKLQELLPKVIENLREHGLLGAGFLFMNKLLMDSFH
jgi:hypothetical protein